MRGFDAGTKKWMHRISNGEIERCLCNIHEIPGFIADGYKPGSATKRLRPQAPMMSLYTYEHIDFSLPDISGDVYKTLSEQKQSLYNLRIIRVPIVESITYLINHPSYKRGRDSHYNIGDLNPNRDPNRVYKPKKYKSHRMYFPADITIKGIYVQKPEVQSYIDKGWIIGLRPFNT